MPFYSSINTVCMYTRFSSAASHKTFSVRPARTRVNYRVFLCTFFSFYQNTSNILITYLRFRLYTAYNERHTTFREYFYEKSYFYRCRFLDFWNCLARNHRFFTKPSWTIIYRLVRFFLLFFFFLVLTWSIFFHWNSREN